MIGRALRQLLAVAVSILLAGVNTPAALGQALPKPDVGPEKPFARRRASSARSATASAWLPCATPRSPRYRPS